MEEYEVNLSWTRHQKVIENETERFRIQIT